MNSKEFFGVIMILLMVVVFLVVSLIFIKEPSIQSSKKISESVIYGNNITNDPIICDEWTHDISFGANSFMCSHWHVADYVKCDVAGVPGECRFNNEGLMVMPDLSLISTPEPTKSSIYTGKGDKKLAVYFPGTLTNLHTSITKASTSDYGRRVEVLINGKHRNPSLMCVLIRATNCNDSIHGIPVKPNDVISVSDIDKGVLDPALDWQIEFVPDGVK